MVQCKCKNIFRFKIGQWSMDFSILLQQKEIPRRISSMLRVDQFLYRIIKLLISVKLSLDCLQTLHMIKDRLNFTPTLQVNSRPYTHFSRKRPSVHKNWVPPYRVTIETFSLLKVLVTLILRGRVPKSKYGKLIILRLVVKIRRRLIVWFLWINCNISYPELCCLMLCAITANFLTNTSCDVKRPLRITVHISEGNGADFVLNAFILYLWSNRKPIKSPV